jgi:hypothetical protein
MIPEQHSDRLEAGDLCFARLISLLLGDPRPRPANRAPSTAGGCNAEASRRYRRLEHRIDACDAHVSELSAELRMNLR